MIPESSSSGSSYNTGETKLTRRHNSEYTEKLSTNDGDLEEIIARTSNLDINKTHKKNSMSSIFVNVLNPFVLTALSAFVRLYRIEIANSVIWDEAHFGKFGSYYLKHEFYFDVHPPLGKLLVGLSGYLAGYDGHFDFGSTVDYPEDINYVLMRIFNCVFGIICTPLAYKTSLLLGYNQLTCWFIALSVVFEMLSLTLSKFILLDSILLFFTVFSYFALINVHVLRINNQLLTRKGIKWLLITGFAIGCVSSTKWVGLFMTALVGLYTIFDLLIKFYQVIAKQLSWRVYLLHWITRILTLIVLPIAIYMSVFKVHFLVLNHAGPGDSAVSTLLQASHEGTDVVSGPRSVAYGSLITLRCQGLSSGLLHSHYHDYPEGSQEQQVTTYSYKDENNVFLVEFDVNSGLSGKHASSFGNNETEIETTVNHPQLLRNGDTLRLLHNFTGSFMHANAISSAVSKTNFEVSCFGGLDTNDIKDEWVLEIQAQEESPSKFFSNESEREIHPISTNFRLRHKELGCYLASTGYSYPAWGFSQGEIVCKFSIFARDKSTWWNVEQHINDKLPQPSETYVPPKPKFWREFVLLNFAMMTSNNALVPDPDRFDKLSSEWWEWPILRIGLRMGSWGANDIKFFLIGNPFITWFSSLSLVLFLFYLLLSGFKYQRQTVKYESASWESLISRGILPFVGWFLHYFPFIIMGRVTYLHHYVPALYFAIFTAGFVVDRFATVVPKRLSYVIYGMLYFGIIGSFWYLRDFAFGMDQSSKQYKHLKILDSWMV
ncbi:Dolichyl-phosphate-mannose--protein mannosyltransferase 6 [Spathaspora sp. JA1]|nr:Dolichyl-phosphate-mannose--protein mannosyltransferase 6 [Spathaspora sp. JA1]